MNRQITSPPVGWQSQQVCKLETSAEIIYWRSDALSLCATLEAD